LPVCQGEIGRFDQLLKRDSFAHTNSEQHEKEGITMGKFMSGLGMGMVAGACMGMAVVGMMSDADRRQMKRRAKKAVQAVEDAAASVGLMM